MINFMNFIQFLEQIFPFTMLIHLHMKEVYKVRCECLQWNSSFHMEIDQHDQWKVLFKQLNKIHEIEQYKPICFKITLLKICWCQTKLTSANTLVIEWFLSLIKSEKDWYSFRKTMEVRDRKSIIAHSGHSKPKGTLCLRHLYNEVKLNRDRRCG